MDPVDRLLAKLLADTVPSLIGQPSTVSDEDHAFIDKMIESVEAGSVGFVCFYHPTDNKIQYMLLNGATRQAALNVIAKLMMRLTE